MTAVDKRQHLWFDRWDGHTLGIFLPVFLVLSLCVVGCPPCAGLGQVAENYLAGGQSPYYKVRVVGIHLETEDVARYLENKIGNKIEHNKIENKIENKIDRKQDR